MDNEDIIQALVKSLGEQKPQLLNDVSSSIKAYISSQGTNCIAINQVYPAGTLKRRWELSLSIDYIRCLYAFCRRKPFQGYELDSSLTVPIVDIVTSRFEAFYQENNEHINDAFLEALAQDSTIINGIVDKIIEKTLKNKSAAHPGQQPITPAILTKITSLVVTQLHAIVHSQAGEPSVDTIKQAIASGVARPIVKTIAIVMVKLLSVHIGAILIKTLSTGAVKKLLVIVLLSTMIKAVTTKLGISAGTIYIAILIPVIIGYITYEVHTFPPKLSKKVATKVHQALESSFDKTNRDIVEEIFRELPHFDFEGIAESLANNSEIQGYLENSEPSPWNS
jgi:hypothetical protein